MTRLYNQQATDTQRLHNGEMPEGWKSIPLKTVATLRKGKKPYKVDKTPWPGAIPYVDIEAFEKGNIRRYADPASSFHIDEGDLLIVWDGARCGYVGKAPTKGALGSTLGKLQPALIDPDYILLFLQSCYGIVNSNPRGIGIPHVEPELFWNLEVPLAPLAEQKRIVTKVKELLARVNAAKEHLTKVSILLKRFRQAVLAAACSGRLTANWRDKQPKVTPVDYSIQGILQQREAEWLKTNASSKKYKPPQDVKNNEVQKLSEGWKYINSDALFSFVTSGSRGWAKHYATSGPIFIRVGNLDHDTISLNLTEIQHVNPPAGQEKERTRVQVGDILISITADVGMVALVRDEIGEAYVNQHVAIARPVTNVFKPYLAWYLASREGGQAQFQDHQRGATKVGLGLNDIRSIAVPFPPIEEQHEIVRRVESMFKLADAVEKRVATATARAEKLTQAILAKAFRGELVPSEADLARRGRRSYEPASKLLAHIKSDKEMNEISVKLHYKLDHKKRSK